MYLTLIFLPFFSFLFLFLFGRGLGRNGASIISLCSLFGSSLLSFIIFYEVVIMDSVCCIFFFNWMQSLNTEISFIFFFDSLTSTMLLLILFVSSLVHLYSLEYMQDDPHLVRFISYLSLFTFFMLILVTSSNFLQMFLGWEGVGIASYLLIGFWFTREQAVKSSLKAILVNRIGDIGFLIVIMCVFSFFGTFNFFTIFPIVPLISNEPFLISIIDILGNSTEIYINKISFLSFFLIVAACAKSAQLGLHTWLPDAMEGPTPVSALIHAATMVTAGIFVLLRCSIFLEFSNVWVITFIILVGSMTSFFASTVGMFQNDLKKIIAYSTCSQLGYMFICCGLSLYNVGLFHLFNHGFFKALLFLSAGSIIHSMSGEQDIRKMGGLVSLLPFSYIMFLLGSLSLSGFPFLSGFYSKDFILETAGLCFNSNYFFAFFFGGISAFFTSFYSFRLIFFVFFDDAKFNKNLALNLKESSFFIVISLCFLCFFALFSGYFFSDLFIGIGNFFYFSQGSFFVNQFNIFFVESELLLDRLIKLLPLFFSVLGIFIALIFNIYYSRGLVYMKRNLFFFTFSFFSKKWYFDFFYNFVFIRLFLYYGYQNFFYFLDRGVFIKFGPVGLKDFLVHYFSYFFLRFQTGKISDYLYFLVIFSLFIFLFIYIYYKVTLSLPIFFLQNSIGLICLFTFFIKFFNEDYFKFS